MRFFVKAVALALALSGAGFGYSNYKHSKTAALQSKCEAEGQRQMKAFNAERKEQTGPWTMYQTAGMTCDPWKLYMDTPSSATLHEAQEELLAAYREQRNGVDSVLYGIAFLIALIGTVPAIWYFLLARLAEIAAAVRRG